MDVKQAIYEAKRSGFVRVANGAEFIPDMYNSFGEFLYLKPKGSNRRMTIEIINNKLRGRGLTLMRSQDREDEKAYTKIDLVYTGDEEDES